MKYLLLAFLLSGCASHTITRVKIENSDATAIKEIQTLRAALSLPRYWNFKSLKDKQRFDSLMRSLPYKTKYSIKYPD